MQATDDTTTAPNPPAPLAAWVARAVRLGGHIAEGTAGAAERRSRQVRSVADFCAASLVRLDRDIVHRGLDVAAGSLATVAQRVTRFSPRELSWLLLAATTLATVITVVAGPGSR